MSIPRRRGSRAQRQILVVTDRDCELLTLIGLCGYVSTEQIACEFFPSVNRCRRRLRQLFDARYLAITLASSTKPNLVSLTRSGLALVLERAPELDGRAHLAGAIRLAGVDHHLAVVDARLYAAAVGARRGEPLVRWSNAGGELGRELDLAAWHLVPDGVALFATSTGPWYVAVEVDCGTEPRSVLANKLDRIKGALTAGALDHLWLIVRAGDERRRGLEELVSAAGIGDRALVLDHAATVGRCAVEPKRGGAADTVRAEGPNTVFDPHRNRSGSRSV